MSIHNHYTNKYHSGTEEICTAFARNRIMYYKRCDIINFTAGNFFQELQPIKV